MHRLPNTSDQGLREYWRRFVSGGEDPSPSAIMVMRNLISDAHRDRADPELEGNFDCAERGVIRGCASHGVEDFVRALLCFHGKPRPVPVATAIVENWLVFSWQGAGAQMTSEAAASIAWAWISDGEPSGPAIECDGSTKKGWEICILPSTPYGHYVSYAVRRVWIHFHK